MLIVIIIHLTFTQVESYNTVVKTFKNLISSSKMHQNAPENKVSDPLLSQLGQLAQGLWYMSESDYPLEPVSSSSPLTNERLVELAQPESPTGTSVERLGLAEFLRHHTSEDHGGMLDDLALTRRFQALESFMKKELDDVYVYRVGGEPRIVILALGTTKDGQQLVGFRTVSIET
jgi:histidine triad (HIT) family protein